MIHLSVVDPHFLPHLGCDLHLRLCPGECIVLTGENGLGKSTFLERLRRDNEVLFLRQKAADLFYDRKLKVLKEILKEVESPGFEELWEDFGLTQKEGRLLSHLSGGESQALKIVSVLSLNGSLLLLDEPSQFLDGEKKEKLKAAIEARLHAHASVVIVEHDLDWVPAHWKVVKLKNVDGVLKKDPQWTT